MRKIILISIFLAALLIGTSGSAPAKNVDLVTLPSRDTVQLTIYNSEDLTLVKEIRQISLKKGNNKLQFSWAGTLIDPTSVRFRALEQVDKIEIADTVFPGQKPQHLYWNIESQFEGQVKVEVTYFTSGLSWQMDYVAICDPGETKMDFRGYVRVFNNSGEEYENAQVRLIVGNINLVEKIADLATEREKGLYSEGDNRDSDKLNRLRTITKKCEELKDMKNDQQSILKELPKSGWSKMAPDRKQIIKEGLSEYFMFTVEGSETIRHGWSKRMEAVNSEATKFEILYRMRAHQYGSRPVKFFIWGNDDEHKLGKSPLPNGRVRVFRDNGKDGLAYLGEQLIRYVPVMAKIEVNLGADDLVVYETKKMRVRKLNFHFKKVENPDAGNFGKEYVDGWDTEERWVETVRNYHTKPIKFELHRMWEGDVVLTPEIMSKNFDYRTVETIFTVDQRAKEDVPTTATTHMGTNAKQSRVLLKHNWPIIH